MHAKHQDNNVWRGFFLNIKNMIQIKTCKLVTMFIVIFGSFDYLLFNRENRKKLNCSCQG